MKPLYCSISAKPAIALICILMLASAMKAQPAGVWRSLLSYKNTTRVVDAESRVFALANNCLYSVSKENPTENPKFYDRSNGLNDTGIAEIGYDPDSRTLLIYYYSGSIDLLSATGVYNLTGIQMNSRLVDKTLHRVLFRAGKAYLCGAFGLVVLDLTQSVILSTYFQGQNITDFTLPDDSTYVQILINGKMLQGDERLNLQDPSQWQEITDARYNLAEAKEIARINAGLLVLTDAGKLVCYPKSGNDAEIIADGTQRIHGIDVSRLGTFARSDDYSWGFFPDKAAPLRLSTGRANALSCNTDPHSIYAAEGEDGLCFFGFDGVAISKTMKVELTVETPANNLYFQTVSSNGRLYVADGGRDADRYGRPFGVKIYDERLWTFFSEKYISEQAREPVRDAVSIAVDPQNPKHFFVGTWGEGLIEFRDDRFYKKHDSSNSPIRGAKGYAKHCDRVGALAFDAQGNLWMAQAEVANATILMLSADGKWHSFSFRNVQDDNSFTRQIIFPNGVHWLGIFHANSGGYIFSDNGTPDNTSDDAARYVSALTDRTGKEIPFKLFNAMAIDRNGLLWIGSENGICSVPGASAALSRQDPVVGVRPVGGREPNLYYILDNVKVNDIAVDRLNQKWIATSGEGLYLMNEDCTQILRHFLTSNSPLLSNDINTLTLAENGILYVGTTQGLMAYETGSKHLEKQTLKEIYAYPNPLRPEMPEGITIGGLPAGSMVKITDAAGVLVFEQTSADSRLRWPATTASGERVGSGVYTVMVYDPESKSSGILRIAIIE